MEMTHIKSTTTPARTIVRFSGDELIEALKAYIASAGGHLPDGRTFIWHPNDMNHDNVTSLVVDEEPSL